MSDIIPVVVSTSADVSMLIVSGQDTLPGIDRVSTQFPIVAIDKFGAFVVPLSYSGSPLVLTVGERGKLSLLASAPVHAESSMLARYGQDSL